MKVLGVDVGGAHIKHAVCRNGRELARAVVTPFEIFRQKDELPAALHQIRAGTSPGAVALTMTGELSDVFRSRAEGVRFILRAAGEAFDGANIRVVESAGRLVSMNAAMRKPMSVASANWAATARWAAAALDEAIIVDIGSTTTDLLPVKGGSPAVIGRTDFERLKNGELLYTGYLRTNAAAVLSTAVIGCGQIRVCPEYFAVVGDAHLYLGDIKPVAYTSPTPDGGPKTRRGAAVRLARLVLSDPAKIGEAGVRGIARQIVEAQRRTLAGAIEAISRRRGLGGSPVILAGSGAAVYRKYLKKELRGRILDKVGEVDAARLDPAACSAAALAAEGR